MAPPLGMRVAALLLAWLSGCSSRGTQPTLLLQLSVITHASATQLVRQRRQDLSFSASLAVPLETHAQERARAPPPTAAGWKAELPDEPDCEPQRDPLCAWAEQAEQLALEHATTTLELPR